MARYKISWTDKSKAESEIDFWIQSVTLEETGDTEVMKNIEKHIKKLPGFSGDSLTVNHKLRRIVFLSLLFLRRWYLFHISTNVPWRNYAPVQVLRSILLLHVHVWWSVSLHRPKHNFKNKAKDAMTQRTEGSAVIITWGPKTTDNNKHDTVRTKVSTKKKTQNKT